MNDKRRKFFCAGTNLFHGLLLWAVCLFPAAVSASEPGSVETLRQTGRAFASIAENASRSVVGIQAEQSVQVRNYWTIPDWPFDDFFEDDFFDRFFRRPGPRGRNPKRQFQRTAQGSGFIISQDGYILTNNHLVSDAEKVTVKLSDERQFDAEIIGTDPDSDVAVIKIDSEDMPHLELADSDDVEVGEWVLAVGNPFGLSHSVTAGIVSASGRSGVGIATYEDFIQTDAAINPGNSGGPLLNLEGRVIGINTAIISRTGGNLGIGLAIPANMAKYIYEQLKHNGEVVRGYLGVSIQDLTKQLAESLGLKTSKGVLIPGVAEGSAADAAGIIKGDVIVEFNGKQVEKAEQLRNKVAMLKPGTEVDVTVLRGGERKTLTVELGRRPSREQLAREDEGGPDMEKRLGLTVQNLTDELAGRLGYEDRSGVVITQVVPGSLAASAGLKPGMLISEVDRKKIANVGQFVSAVNEAKERGSVLLLVSTGRYSRYVVLRLPE